MRDINVLSFMTLDGVTQGPTHPGEDPSNGFTHSGWAAPYFEETMGLVDGHFMAKPQAFLFGRKTFDMFAAHCPTATSDHAQIFNKSQKFVVSTEMKSTHWAGTEIISGDVVARLRAIKSETGTPIQVHGSSGLIQTLLTHDLVDEFRLFIFPVIVGGGQRLFGPDTLAHRLVCTAQDTTAQGVIMATYRRI